MIGAGPSALGGAGSLAPPAAARLADRTRLHLAIWLFIVSMIVPADLAFEVQGLRLDPQRLVLLAFSAGVIAWVCTKARLGAHDLCILAAGLWAAAATMTTLPPLQAVERGGSFLLETVIAYLLPSAFLTRSAELRLLVFGLFAVVAVLGVLAGLEAWLGEHVIANEAARLMDRPEPFTAEERLGLLRARVSFSHQILFGVFCAALFAFFWYEAETAWGRAARAGFTGMAVFFSLSSAAFLLFVLQAAMIWVERATRRLRHRLWLLGGLAVAAWLAIEIVVNGGLTGFVTRYLSLNPSTAYYRQLIWMHVTDDILAHPWTGTGGAWTRPGWMVESVDHFYFSKALRYGIPPVVLICLAAALILRGLVRRPLVPGSLHWQATLGWLFCVAGLGIAGLTVDYFGRMLPFTMFILGLGAAWLRIAAREPWVDRPVAGRSPWAGRPLAGQR